MTAPLGNASPTTRRRVLWASGVIALLLWIFLVHQDGEIKEGGGPGIVPFEVAGSADRTQEILGEWGGEGQDAATVSLLVDYPYLIAYGIFLGVACGAVSIRLARRGRERLARAGGLIGWGALGAAVFDAIEDGALLRMLDGHTDGWPTLALIAAIGKFTLFALAVIYILAGLFLSRGGLKAAEAA